MKAIDEALEKAEEQVARYIEAAKETKVLLFGLYFKSTFTVLWIRNVPLRWFFYDPDKITWLLTGVENWGKRVQLCLV